MYNLYLHAPVAPGSMYLLQVPTLISRSSYYNISHVYYSLRPKMIVLRLQLYVQNILSPTNILG